MTDGAVGLSLHHVAATVGRGTNARSLLSNITLDVPAGKTLVLLGRSGAGKTTLLRVVAGLQPIEEGQVRIGADVVQSPEESVPPEQRGVGLVFQTLELWPHRTVAEHVAFGMTPRRFGRSAAGSAAVHELMERVGLPLELARRRPGTLSGGEQQRVAIARALGGAPRVMLYDEPLASLDPERRRSLRALLRALRREHAVTSIYVSHDPEDALELGDEVAVLSDGFVVETGTPADLYRQPATVEGARALGRASLVPATQDERGVHTVLGSWAAGELPGGPKGLACWRPEDVECVQAGAGTDALVVDAVAVHDGYVLEARVGEHTLWAHTTDAVAPDTAVSVRPSRPPTWIPAAAPTEVLA